MTFEKWFAELTRLALAAAFPLPCLDEPERYLDYYEEGDPPATALLEEMENATWEAEALGDELGA